MCLVERSDGMDRSIDFWAPRVCFFSPIPELDRVADLLAEAGEALLAANYAFAIERLRQADLPAVAEYALKIMGREDLGIHRRRKVEVAPSNVLKAKKRAPTAAV